MHDTSLDDNEREAMRILRAIAGAAIAGFVAFLAGACAWKSWLMTETTATAVIAAASGMRWWLPPLYIAAAALMMPLILSEVWYVSAAVRRRQGPLIRPAGFSDARSLAAIGLFAFALLNALQVAVTWRLDHDALHGYYSFEAGMALSCAMLIGAWVNWLSIAQGPRRRWPLVVWAGACAVATQAAAEGIAGPRDDLADLDFQRLAIIAGLAALGALAKTLHEQIDTTRPRAPFLRPTAIRMTLAALLGASWYVVAAIAHNRGFVAVTQLEVALIAAALGASYGFVIDWLARARDDVGEAARGTVRGVAARVQSWIVGRVPDGNAPPAVAPAPEPEPMTQPQPQPLVSAPPLDLDLTLPARPSRTRPGAFGDTDSLLMGPPDTR